MERGTLIAGRYELYERLGRGGMGEVWAGRDRDLHREVAVKLLAADEDAPADLLHRFDREAVAAAQINHPNVVALYDRGVHDDLRFLVMERVDGTTLARHMREHGPMPTARALEIAQEVCAALVAAHRARVVHYDIKPSNVMLTADGRVKVVDFGIAGFTHAHTFTVAPTSMLAPAGTARYGAPEQFLDQRGDERSDLYALGGVLFALLTGEPPFGDGAPLSVIRRKLDDEPPLGDMRPDVPEPVAGLLADLLQRAADRRPQTASAVYERLEDLRSGGAAHAPGTGRPVRSAPTLVEPSNAGGAFEIAWTGREAVPTAQGRPPRWGHWALYAVLMLAYPYVIAGTVIESVIGEVEYDEVFVSLCILLLYTAVLHRPYGWWLWSATLNWRRYRRAIEDRGPWSLRVDAAGITTTDACHATLVGGPAGRRTYGWNLVTDVTLEYVAEFRWGPSHAALHIRPQEKGPQNNFPSPAGMVRPRSPRGKAGRGSSRPLCVLGHMTEQQHEALIAALARNAGPRWKPGLSE